MALPHSVCGLNDQCGPCRFGLPAVAGDFAAPAAGWPDPDLLPRPHRRSGVLHTGAPTARRTPGDLATTASRTLCVDDRTACTGRGLCGELLPEPTGLGAWGSPVIRNRAVPDHLRAHARRAAAARPAPSWSCRLDTGR
ncbi:ferredoxin [Actinacidiphila sp. bgisy160]|uniref:ferredoxin n=1 Tax=Actinacidiphila sp. bgisy160 TaxID=3413796 RepID=UPI003D754E5B